MAGPMPLQPAIGRVLEWSWHGTSANGVPIYDLAAYRAGFSLMVAWCVVATVLVAFARETRCRPRDAPQGLAGSP